MDCELRNIEDWVTVASPNDDLFLFPFCEPVKSCDLMGVYFAKAFNDVFTCIQNSKN
jgi:hypothetical protein